MTDQTETPADIARAFHESYERLAPSHSYETRAASAKPWADVPDNNKSLMIAVVAELIEKSVIRGSKPKRLWVKRSLAVMVLGTLAIGGLIFASVEQELTVLDYCDLPEARCDACPSGEPECGDSLTWCCPVSGGPCYEVTLMSACDPEAEYAVVCEHGQTNGDGTITCYD